MQAREIILSLLHNDDPLPIETVYAKCSFDFDAFAGALSSLIEKGSVRTGRYIATPDWLVGNLREDQDSSGDIIWNHDRGAMRQSLSKILKELKRDRVADTPVKETEEQLQQIERIQTLLSDGKPRRPKQLALEAGLESLPSYLTRYMALLPDGSYTLPDSTAARDFFWTHLSEKPRRLSALMRLLHKHPLLKKEILEALDKGERLIRMPRGFVSTPFTPEGLEVLSKRGKLDQCQAILKSLAFPIFTLSETGIDDQTARNTIGKHAVTIIFNDRKMYCLRRSFPGAVVRDQLYGLIGRSLTPPTQTSVPAYLKSVSMGEKEAQNYLNIDQYLLQQMIRNKALETLTIDGKLRFWREDIEQLKTNPHLMRSLTRDFLRYNISQAAIMLKTNTEQIKRLIREGRFKPSYEEQDPAPGVENNHAYFTRKDIAILRTMLKDSLPRNRQDGSREKRPVGGTAKKPLPLKKRLIKPETPLVKENSLDFQLDAFQSQAVEAVCAQQSVLLSAPTGNGKTLVAEILAKDLMAKDKGMVYTSPLKALSNQKYRDFKEIFGEDKVGLVTGDISVNSDAPLLIMTTEIFRNWCLSEQDQLANTAYVVFDEFHYLDDHDRGTTWEESILFAPPHIKFLGLSATVPNIKEIATWVSTVRGEEVLIIEEKKRHVPLEICWLSPEGKIVDEHVAKQVVSDLTEYQKAYRNRRLWAEE